MMLEALYRSRTSTLLESESKCTPKQWHHALLTYHLKRRRFDASHSACSTLYAAVRIKITSDIKVVAMKITADFH